MHYVYEAEIEYNEEDSCWYSTVPVFNGEVYADGRTVEEVSKNTAEALSLTIAYYVDEGLRLPKPVFHHPPQSVISVDVTDEFIAVSKCLTIKQAAEELEVTPGRICQLLDAGLLETYMHGDTRMVTIASINERKLNKPAPHRPKLTVIPGATAQELLEG